MEVSAEGYLAVNFLFDFFLLCLPHIIIGKSILNRMIKVSTIVYRLQKNTKYISLIYQYTQLCQFYRCSINNTCCIRGVPIQVCK